MKYTTLIPHKIREVHNHHFDSTVWNDFVYRDSDIVIGSYAKSGTTWLQQIIGQLVFKGSEKVNVSQISPWLDFRGVPKDVKLNIINGQKHRRFIKTHLPLDALPYNQNVRYIYIARDGRDVAMSMFNHHYTATDEWYNLLNNTPGLVGAPIPRIDNNPRKFFLDWLYRDGYPWWSYWDNVESWWNYRDCENILIVHYNDLLFDLPGQVQRLSDFIGESLDADQLQNLLRHSSFAFMKSHANEIAPFGGIFWHEKGDDFIFKGTNGRWKGVLTDADSHMYESIASEILGNECANWLFYGSKNR